MNAFQIIMVVLEAIASVALVVVVLLQSGKEAGLSGALTGGSSESYLSKNKGGSMDQILAKSTKWIAIAWAVLTLILNLA